MLDSEREELVKQIIEAGQELIDRAESLIGEGIDCVTNVSINIDLTPFNRTPEITISTSVLRMNTIKRWREG